MRTVSSDLAPLSFPFENEIATSGKNAHPLETTRGLLLKIGLSRGSRRANNLQTNQPRDSDSSVRSRLEKRLAIVAGEKNVLEGDWKLSITK